MRESRIAPRSTAKKRGTAAIGGRAEIDCVIRDISPIGARLNFPHPTILPRAFRLKFDGQDHKVTVIWQAGLLAGVRFHAPIKPFASAPKKRGWPWSRK